MKKEKKPYLDYTKKGCHIQFLFSDIVKYLYFTRIWLWQRPKYYYLDKGAVKKLKKKFMIVANHQSFGDCLFAYYTFLTKRIYFMVTDEMFNNKFKSWVAKRLLCVPLDPSSGSLTTMRVMMDILIKDNIVCIYPEGHINFANDKVKAFKGGATLIAAQTGCDVVPMYRERRKHWWQRQRIIVGEPYNPKAMLNGRLSRTDLDKINEYVFENELKLKRIYQELIPAKLCQRYNTQVFVIPMPFETKDNKISNIIRQEEINSCKSEKTRNEKFYSWKLLERVFNEHYGENINRLNFKKQPNGKWVCDRYCVSISHSGDLVTVAIASYPIGVDIQLVDEIKVSKELMNKVYDDSELKEEITAEQFAKDWSIKEAAFKCSDDDGFNPKKYKISSIENKETQLISYQDKTYSLGVVTKNNDVISYHFLTPDIAGKN